jgi:hypothetical protein
MQGCANRQSASQLLPLPDVAFEADASGNSSRQLTRRDQLAKIKLDTSNPPLTCCRLPHSRRFC